MTYDLYGAWDGETGHNAPLHKGQGYENVAKDKVYTVDVALEYWLGQGKIMFYSSKYLKFGIF